MSTPRPSGWSGVRSIGGADGVTALTAYVVVLLAVPSPMVITAFGQVGGPNTLVALVCFLWWLWYLVQRSHTDWAPAPTVRGAALVLLLAVLLSYAHSASLALPGSERSPADGALLRIVGLVGLVCVAIDGIGSWDRLWVLARRWTLALGALSLLVVVQIATGEVWVDRLSLPGLSTPEGLALIQRGQIIRPSGTAVHPIELASVLAMCLPLVLVVAARETERPWLFRSIALVVPTLVLMSGSRTALVCGILAFGVLLASWGARARLAGAFGGFALLAVMFVTMPGFIGSLRGLFVGASQDPSVASRTNSYSVVFAYWREHKWLGRGVGTFLPEYWILDNQYLGLLIGGGVLVVASMLGLVGAALWSAGRAARRAGDANDRHLSMALLAGVAAGAVSLGLFDAFAFPQASGTFFMLVGLAGQVGRLTVHDSGDMALVSPK